MTGVLIDPERVYTEFEVVATGLVTFGDLARARLKGELRCREVSRGRRTYLGRWLIAWLEGEPCATGR